jgi:hypothetical protein
LYVRLYVQKEYYEGKSPLRTMSYICHCDMMFFGEL